MNIVLKGILTVIIGYLLGSVNTSIIVSKFYGIDIREHGSKNAGMTNTLRVLGKFAGILVILGDVIKGVVSAYIGRYILGEVNGVLEVGMMLGGLGAIIGHNFPIYFGFKGGKGVLTTAAIIAVLDPKIWLILFMVFLLVVIITRYISLGSIVCTLLLPVVIFVLKTGNERNYMLIWGIVVAVSALVMHRQNIIRLIKGQESKFSIKK